eukprot:XP_003724265.1 PREDICTED: uncharacterized protein LOC100889579 [Strongylocentrotus purpuratus]
MGSPGKDDSFVSISLDEKECEICLQDTGQELMTCDVCARYLTSGPVQEGFNELPELIHTDTLAHASCFRKFHKLARRLSRSAMKLQSKSQADNIRTTQWLNFKSNNLGNELLLENIRNHMSKSNPGSRSGSPQFSGASQIGKLRDAERCRSEPVLDSSIHELRRSYTKYLFGKHEGDGKQNMKVPEQRPRPVHPVRDGLCGPSNEVPATRLTDNDSKKSPDSSLSQTSCKLESSPYKSCHSNPDQYLTKMRTLSLKDQEHHGHNTEECQETKAESCSDANDSRTLNGHTKTTFGAAERDIDSSHGNKEMNLKERIEDDVHPCDNRELWRDVRHLNKESLPGMSMAELKSHVEMLQSAVNDACSQLVQHLQEKDVLSSEVASRHVTIKKLVERQTTLHH